MPNRHYEKGRRFEYEERNFWRKFFGHYGECNRSGGSRGADIRFFDYLLRSWTVSCKCKKLPKWIWKELENQDILSVREDRKLPIRIITEAKLEELLGKKMADSQEERDD